MSASANLQSHLPPSAGVVAQARLHQLADDSHSAFLRERTLENGMAWLNAEIAHLQAHGQKNVDFTGFLVASDLLNALERTAMPLFSLRHHPRP